MTTPLRCKLTGCDLDDCGVCRRCGAEQDASHDWREVERERDCFRRERCDGCGREREQPDHDWQPGTTASGASSLICSRCELAI